MDIDSIRRSRLEKLIREHGPSGLADKIGKTPSQVSHWRKGREAGGKSISTATARDMERKLGLPNGWMDTAVPPLGDGLHALLGASQPARLSAATVVNTTQALKIILGRRGIEYDPIDHAAMFVAVYQEAANLPESPSIQESMRFVSVVTDIVNTHMGG